MQAGGVLPLKEERAQGLRITCGLGAGEGSQVSAGESVEVRLVEGNQPGVAGN